MAPRAPVAAPRADVRGGCRGYTLRRPGCPFQHACQRRRRGHAGSAVAFYQTLRDGGFAADELGFSFYPSSSERPPQRLQAFQKTVTTVHRELARPVFIAEFGYPAEIRQGRRICELELSRGKVSSHAEGQAGILHDLAAWGVKNGVSGIRPWAPELAVPGWEPFALFSRQGKTITSRAGLGAIAAGIAASGQ